jgi:hypothetical protein
MAQVLKPTPVAQADFGRNLKPALAAKLFVFSDFFALAFWKVLFVFCILSPPRVAQSRLLQSHIKSISHGILKSTSKVAYQSPPCAATKFDFGFQVAFQSPLRAAQSRLRFSSRILKSALPASKVDFGRI